MTNQRNDEATGKGQHSRGEHYVIQDGAELGHDPTKKFRKAFALVTQEPNKSEEPPQIRYRPPGVERN